ncbi:SAL1 phosphatase [Linum perenne]
MSVTVTVTIMMRQAKGCCCHFKINNAINNSTITSFSFSHTHTSSSSAAPIASAGPSSTLSLSLRRRKPLFVSSSAASMSSLSYAKELLAAKKAVSLAARLCQKVQRALLQSDVQSKSDKSPVTVADYGSQAVISLVLQKELPSVPFSLVAEEDSGDLRNDSAQDIRARITELVNDTLSTDGSFSTLSVEQVLKAIDCGISEGGSTGRHWVLDPIDGTKGFVRGDQYAIALALLDEGKVVLGVLGCPNLPQPSPGEVGCLFFATVGAGTYMQSLEGDLPLQQVTVTATENPEEASFFESYEAAHSLRGLTSSIAEKLGVKAPPVRIDSQAKYGALSRGDGAIYMRFPHKGYREKIWDHAAGCIVVTEAGGLVCDAAGNALDFSKGRYLDLDTGIISTNPKLMPLLLKAVSESKDSSSSTSSM